MKWSGLVRIVLTILSALALHSIHARIEFTNIQCTLLDRDFGVFQYCHIVALNRTNKYMSVRMNIFQLPITNITVTFALMKRANGYKPFLYNVTIDGCRFMRTRYNKVMSFFLDLYLNETNMNHTCPYNHDLIVDNLQASKINRMFTEVLPMPHGQYAFFTAWSAYNKPRGLVNVYFRLY